MLARSRLYRPRGLRLPGGQPRIDWTNPITAGLVGCWVPTGEGGAKPIIRDLVSGASLAPVGSPVIRATSTGLAAQDLLGANGWSGLAAPSQQPTKQFSVLWHGQAVASTVSDSVNPPFLACNYDNTSTAEFSWGLVRGIGVGASPTNVRLEWGGSTTTSLNAAGLLPSTNSNALVSILASVMSGGPIYFYKNGLLFTSNAAPSFTSNYSATPTIRMGLAQDGASASGMATKQACLWNRQLTAGESALISADPTCFLLFPGDLINAQAVGARIFVSLNARGVGSGFSRVPLIGAAAMNARGRGTAEGRALLAGKTGLSVRALGAGEAQGPMAPLAKFQARGLGAGETRASSAAATQLSAQGVGAGRAKTDLGGATSLSALGQGAGRVRAKLSFGAVRRRAAVFFRGLRGN